MTENKTILLYGVINTVIAIGLMTYLSLSLHEITFAGNLAFAIGTVYFISSLFNFLIYAWYK